MSFDSEEVDVKRIGFTAHGPPENKDFTSLKVVPSKQGTSEQSNEKSSSQNPAILTASRKRSRRIWTLVSGDGHDFKCNICKKIIACCSPMNINLHYSSQHPEILAPEEISKVTKAESVPDDNYNSRMDTTSSSVSSDNRSNIAKIDWSSPPVMKVLEMIASRELTEKMGTEMISYKTGCQMSQSTVRKRVHSMLKEKYGTLVMPKKRNVQNVSNEISDEKVETNACVDISKSHDAENFIKREGKKCGQQESSNKTENASSLPPVPRQVRSLRLSRSSIVIPEKNDPSKVRIYRCSAYGRGKHGATCYYRCSKCDSIANNKLKTSVNALAGERTKRYFAHIKTKDGQIIGNAYPEHLPECKPLPKEVQQLQEIDRACRARIQAGNLTPEAARKLGALVAQKNRELKTQIQDDDTFPDKWKSLPKKYSRLCHQAERIRRQKNRELLRLINNDGNGDGADDNLSGIAHEAEIMSGRFKHPPLIIFEPDGQAARIYRINGKSDRLSVLYYRCSKCDVLCRRHRRLGIAEGMNRATVKVEGNEILENVYPVHHEECEVFTLDMVKSLAENLERFYFAKDFEHVIHDSAKTDLRFGDGTLISKNQSPLCGHSAVVDIQGDVGVNTSNATNVGEINVGDAWYALENQELLNSNEDDQQGFPNVCCQRYYEANVALQRDMMRCLEEMKALRSEMRSMLLEGGKLQYVELEDDNYEEIIVDETN